MEPNSAPSPKRPGAYVPPSAAPPLPVGYATPPAEQRTSNALGWIVGSVAILGAVVVVGLLLFAGTSRPNSSAPGPSFMNSRQTVDDDALAMPAFKDLQSELASSLKEQRVSLDREFNKIMGSGGLLAPANMQSVEKLQAMKKSISELRTAISDHESNCITILENFRRRINALHASEQFRRDAIDETKDPPEQAARVFRQYANAQRTMCDEFEGIADFLRARSGQF